MKILIILTLLGAIIGTTPVAFGTNYEASNGYWSWEGDAAFTEWGNGVRLVVGFPPATQCNQAQFILNDNVNWLAMNVDGQQFRPVTQLTKAGGGVTFLLTPAAVSAIKHGSLAFIESNKGYLTLSLDGSAKAFNAAFTNCLALSDRPQQRYIAPAFTKISVGQFDSGGTYVVFAGQFEQGDADRIIHAVKQHKALLVRLESEGGLLSEALKLGMFLWEKGVGTMTLDTCASACTYALAAGKTSLVGKNARVGVHQFSLAKGRGTMQNGQETVAAIGAYLRMVGADPTLVIAASAVNPNNIYWLSEDELLGYGVATKILN